MRILLLFFIAVTLNAQITDAYIAESSDRTSELNINNYDIGTLAYGTTYSDSMKMWTIGDLEVILDTIYTSSVAASLYQDTVTSAGLYLKFTVNTAQRGSFQDTITIESDASNSPMTRYVDWNINELPIAPTNLIATAGNQQVVLTWDDDDDVNLEKVYIYADQTATATTLIDSVNDGVETYTHSGLGNSEHWYYRLKSKDSYDEFSSYSSEVDDITDAGSYVYALNLDGTQLAYNNAIGTGLDQTGALDLTIDGWFYLDATTAGQYIFTLGRYGDYDRVSVYVSATDSIRGIINEGGVDSVYADLSLPADSTWYNFKMVIKKSTDEMDFYMVGVDTSLANSISALGDFSYSTQSGEEMTIGAARYTSETGNMTGQIGTLSFTMSNDSTVVYDWAGSSTVWLQNKGTASTFDLTGDGLE